MKNTLKEVIISLTHRCNGNCRMCDIPDDADTELPSSCWKQVIKDAYILGASTVVFSGGEPFLRDDLFELISYVKQNHMNACVTTNGLLLDEKRARALYESGIDVVNVSLEGNDKVHEYLRGTGSFSKVTSALAYLQHYKIETTIATMVSRYNYKYLPEIVSYARKYDSTTIKFQPFNSLFLHDKTRNNDFFITHKEVPQLQKIIGKVIHACDTQGISTNPVSYLEKIPGYLSGDSFRHRSMCMAPWQSCPIAPGGDVYLCWVLAQPDKTIGNVKEERLLDMWNSERHNAMRESLRQRGCRGCMMSCYDEVFGGDSVKRMLTKKIEAMKNRRLKETLNKAVTRWRRRWKFYSSYQGTFSDFVKKIEMFLKKKISGRKTDITVDDGLARTLSEIARARDSLQRELKLLQ
ncbi:MAG: radical SAM protein [Candidatus Omnitrophica bacterium]|nr:radical SAM protein [Candidatus Omnitrophota bacterium]